MTSLSEVDRLLVGSPLSLLGGSQRSPPARKLLSVDRESSGIVHEGVEKAVGIRVVTPVSECPVDKRVHERPVVQLGVGVADPAHVLREQFDGRHEDSNADRSALIRRLYREISRTSLGISHSLFNRDSPEVSRAARLRDSVRCDHS